jgi:hypothetical protein
MRKVFFTLAVVLLPFFMSVSCGEEELGYADVTVYNNSDFDVYDFQYGGQLGQFNSAEIKKGETYNFGNEFMPANPVGLPFGSVEYILNGKQFDRMNAESVVVDDVGVYYIPQFLKDGAKARVYIKNEGFELVIEGGGYYLTPGSIPPRD